MVTPTLDTEFNLTSLLNGAGYTMHSFTDSPSTNSWTSTIGAGSGAATWSSLLDENGNLKSFTGPGYTGNVVWTAGQPTDVNWFPSYGGSVNNVHTSYDGFGRVLSTLGITGVSHEYTYDDEDNVTQDKLNSSAFATSYVYAPNGARTSMTVNVAGLSSYVYSYTYDKNGNVTAIAVNYVDGAPVPGAGANYTYDALNRVTAVRTPQITTLYTYDAFGNVSSLLNWTADSVGVDDPYYKFQEPNGTWHSVFSSFTNITYDLQNNRTGMQATVRGLETSQGGIYYSNGTATYSFGTSNNNAEVWNFPSVTGDFRYGLDLGENLGIVRGENFTIDPNSDRFTRSTTTFSGGIGYDASGNETAFRGLTATYDLAGELRTVVNGGRSIVQTADYDADGLRTRLDTQSGLQTFYYDGDELVYHYYAGSAGSPIPSGYAFYVWGPTGPIQEIGLGYVSSFTFDPNGSAVSRITQNQGQPPTWEAPTLYDAYGLPAYHDPLAQGAAPPLTHNPFGYKGQVGYLTDGIDVSKPSGIDLANNTGLIYCHHRYYDPYAGRWISRDPTGLDGGENAYEFCDGNPLMKVDPSGLGAAPAVVFLRLASGGAGTQANRMIASRVVPLPVLACIGAAMGGYAVGTYINEKTGASLHMADFINDHCMGGAGITAAAAQPAPGFDYHRLMRQWMISDDRQRGELEAQHAWLAQWAATVKPWSIDPSKSVEILIHPTWGKFYKQHDGFWWTKDKAHHGKAQWKVYVLEGMEMVHQEDADWTGKYMNKHKSEIGKRIPLKEFHH